MDLHKALEKIQKCLRLSKSANSNEAAIALHQAQKLMALFNLTEEGIAALGYGDCAVDVPIQKNKKTPLVLSMLCSVIKKAFGVKLVIEDRIGISDTSYRIRYFGEKARVEMAGYAHAVLYRAMEAAWKDYLLMHPIVRGARGYRTSFQVGWLSEVAAKVDAIGFTPEEERAIEVCKEKFYGHALVKSKTNNQGIYSGVAGQGAAAAKNFSIHRPMNAERNRLEKLA